MGKIKGHKTMVWWGLGQISPTADGWH